MYNPNYIKEKEKDASKTINCVNCGAVMSDNDDKCEYCGSISEHKMKYAKSSKWLINSIQI